VGKALVPREWGRASAERWPSGVTGRPKSLSHGDGRSAERPRSRRADSRSLLAPLPRLARPCSAAKPSVETTDHSPSSCRPTMAYSQLRCSEIGIGPGIGVGQGGTRLPLRWAGQTRQRAPPPAILTWVASLASQPPSGPASWLWPRLEAARASTADVLPIPSNAPCASRSPAAGRLPGPRWGRVRVSMRSPSGLTKGASAMGRSCVRASGRRGEERRPSSRHYEQGEEEGHDGDRQANREADRQHDLAGLPPLAWTPIDQGDGVRWSWKGQAADVLGVDVRSCASPGRSAISTRTVDADRPCHAASVMRAYLVEKVMGASGSEGIRNWIRSSSNRRSSGKAAMTSEMLS
jgi:hypothetical protein